jgi:hypothetical protein
MWELQFQEPEQGIEPQTCSLRLSLLSISILPQIPQQSPR